MNKIFLLIFLCFSVVFGETDRQLYDKALEFEQNGDYENAMLYYKMSAQKTLDNSQNTNENLNLQEENTVSEPILPQNTNDNESNLSSDQNSDINEFLGIRMYEPMYLVGAYDFAGKAGRENQEIKFQLSFEKPLFYDTFGLNETISFAYTQTSWWQIWEESSPFRETNYKPEFFMSIPVDLGAMQYFRVGLLHESNGRDGPMSRSWNKAYLQSGFKFGNLEVTPRIWQSFFVGDGNDDISAYMGYADLRLGYDYDGHKFSALLRNNLKFNSDNRGAVELGWMFPLFDSGVYGYVQYFNGYGESLIDYDEHVNKIGVGFTIFK